MPETKTAQIDINWNEIAGKMLISRAMDDLEENKFVPEKKVLYQFSARGHELGQLILASLLDKPKDSVSAYYRSRPLAVPSCKQRIVSILAIPRMIHARNKNSSNRH